MRIDRRERLALLPLDDPSADDLLAALTPTERFESWRLLRRNGSTVSHLGLRGRLPDALYGLVSSRRELLGRIVPDGDAPHRFP